MEKGLEKLRQKRTTLIQELRTQYALELGERTEPGEILVRVRELAQERGIEFVHGKGKRKSELQKQIEQL